MKKPILIIAKYTFQEYLRSRILLSVIVLGFLLMFTSFLATELTYKTIHRVVVDFGFGLATLSSISMAVFLGVNLISTEIENRTLYMVLSKPVSRTDFFIGKILGLSLMNLLNVFILVFQTFLMTLYFDGSIDTLFYFVFVLIFLESLLMLSLSVFFSLFTNRYLAMFFVFALYVVGHALDNSIQSRMADALPSLKIFLELINVIFPMFYKLNFKDYLLYDVGVDNFKLFLSIVYGSTYIIFVNFVNLLIFNKQDLD